MHMCYIEMSNCYIKMCGFFAYGGDCAGIKLDHRNAKGIK